MFLPSLKRYRLDSGEYAERIDNADELLESFLEGFHDENTAVQLQLLTAIVKLFLKRPTETQDLVQQVSASCRAVFSRTSRSISIIKMKERKHKSQKKKRSTKHSIEKKTQSKNTESNTDKKESTKGRTANTMKISFRFPP